jgi:hypothetical protein
VKVKHESDFASYPDPEKRLMQWAMSEILQYKLTISGIAKELDFKK